jgi:hypothetical protein
MLPEDVIEQSDEIIERAIDVANVFQNAVSIRVVERASGNIMTGYIVGWHGLPNGVEVVMVRDMKTLGLASFSSDDARYTYLIDSIKVGAACRIAHEALNAVMNQQLIEC